MCGAHTADWMHGCGVRMCGRGAAAFRKQAGALTVFDDARRLADDVLAANSDIF